MINQKYETLLKVIETGTYSKAAEELKLTQPAVSFQMKTLEDELGIKLFYKNRNGYILTPEGEIVAKYTHRIEALREKMLNELNNVSKEKLKFGVTHTSESNIISEVLAQYCSNNPNVSMSIITDDASTLLDMLAKYDIDMAIVDERKQQEHIFYKLLGKDKLVCILNHDHPFADKKSISINDLKKCNLILRSESSATRQLFESSLKSVKEDIIDFNVLLEVDNTSTIRNLIKKDFGVSILPISVCQKDIRNGSLIALPVDELMMERDVYIAYHDDNQNDEMLNELFDIYNDISSVQ